MKDIIRGCSEIMQRNFGWVALVLRVEKLYIKLYFLRNGRRGGGGLTWVELALRNL